MSEWFAVKSRVTWTSSGTVKQGVVVRVVYKAELAEKGAPWQIAKQEFPDHRRMFDGWQLPGNADVAYFVEVCPGTTGRAKKRLYMPYPSQMMQVFPIGGE